MIESELDWLTEIACGSACVGDDNRRAREANEGSINSFAPLVEALGRCTEFSAA
jgi:hypothetical protein